MRLLNSVYGLVVILALGGCNSSSDTPKTADEVKTEVARMERPEPGMYRTTINVLDVTIPGMDAARAEQMKKLFGTTSKSTEACLTKAQADKGFEELNKRAAQGDCRYDNFKADGGRIDARMTCKTGRGMTMTYDMHGTFTSTGSQLKMAFDASMMPMPGRGMHIEAEVKNERIGDCP
ncbi:DUF3617 domain-containing protein [Novosphingobium sp.]|uniref:DUF3617 domain-containing protein n=1 Tax=Novosphingobium sp. TaxID=1874826 RepID=UPI0025ECAD72|nr:DUF3617 domain-containing protein [Novosphingobium sp.]